MKVVNYRNGGQDIIVEKGDLISDLPHLGANTPVGICPKCGENLVIRNGKNGKFIGCDGFKDGCKSSYSLKGFKAIKNMTISLNRCRIKGRGFELLKSLRVED